MHAAQPKPEHQYATLHRVAEALHLAIGVVPASAPAIATAPPPPPPAIDVEPAPPPAHDDSDAMADIDALLGGGVQGSFGVFRKSIDALRTKLTAIESRIAAMIRQYPSLDNHTQTPAWNDTMVESYCFELLSVLHRLRKSHSTLIALRKRTRASVMYTNCAHSSY